MSAHSSILAWEISWTEESSGLQPWGHNWDLATTPSPPRGYY